MIISKSNLVRPKGDERKDNIIISFKRKKRRFKSRTPVRHRLFETLTIRKGL